MSSFSQKLQQIRKSRNLSQTKFAELTGSSKQSISFYESDLRSPKIPFVMRVSDAFNIPLEFLVNDNLEIPDNALLTPATNLIPLIGTIACGTPILAEQNIEGSFPAPDFIHADFCLRCKGDSMIGARVLDGDIAYIRLQEDVTDGEIAAVLIDDEATLKRVRHLPGGMIQLLAENPAYPPMYLGGADETRSVRIIGKAVYFLSRLR